MTNEQHDECRVTVDGVAPALVRVLRTAAGLASGRGRNWVGVEDLYAALASEELAPIWWPREGQAPITMDQLGGFAHSELEGDTVPLSYNEFRNLTTKWLPGPTPNAGPAFPATVSYEISGPNEDEFRRMIERL